MDFGNRLLFFIIHCYKSQAHFCKILNIKKSVLNRYTRNISFPNFKILEYFYKSGLSLNWLISGEGSMFAENSIGFRLKKNSLVNNSDFINKISGRLQLWISENFETIENFCLFFSIDISYMENILENNSMPELHFVNFIESTGCNYKWIYSGTGSKYNTTPVGKILRYKNINLNYLINYIDRNIKSDIIP